MARKLVSAADEPQGLAALLQDEREVVGAGGAAVLEVEHEGVEDVAPQQHAVAGRRDAVDRHRPVVEVGDVESIRCRQSMDSTRSQGRDTISSR